VSNTGATKAFVLRLDRLGSGDDERKPG